MQGRARFAWQGNRVLRTPRFRVRIPPKTPVPHKPDALLEGFCPEPGSDEQIALNSEGQLLLLRLADVNWLEGAEDRVVLHFGSKSHPLNEPLASIAAKLPLDRFAWVGVSTLLNVGQING
jgi:hypothetical protein